MEFLVVIAALVPFSLGAWVLAIAAYGRARDADRRVAALERRLATLESGREKPTGEGSPER